MARRLYVDGPNGRIAIYDVVGIDPDTENEPLSAPLSNIARLHFHSDLEYPATIQVYTGTVNLPAMSANQTRTASYGVASHGQPGIPYVEGRINIGGTWVPLAGHIPVVQQVAGGSNQEGFARWLALGADGSSIILHEYSLSHMSQSYGAASFDYEIYLTNKLVA